MCEALTFLLANIYIIFGTKLFSLIVSISMGKTAHRLWLICSCSVMKEEKQSEVVEAFSSTPRYFDDFLNIDNDYFDGLISQFYPSELQ